MDSIKSYSFRSFAWIMVFMLVPLAVVETAVYFGTSILFSKLLICLSSQHLSPDLRDLLTGASRHLEYVKLYVVPITAAGFFLFALFLWLILRGSAQKIALDHSKKSGTPPGKKDEKPVSEKEERQRKDKRMFLHLLSVLQREGRLVDFLSEDLSLYEDAQIGAAVRTIHESCKKTIEKYVAPTPILDKNEGDDVTVPPGFDPDSIKLTGNVAGEPPFKGVLRHRGWQASKQDAPVLSGEKDSKIIAPAEVEII